MHEVTMRAVELFCGAGGMSRGLLDAGFEIALAYDAWAVAVETYRQNVGLHVRQVDLSNLLPVIPEIAKLRPDLICGGPPCQDYSLAGRRTEGTNANLTLAFAIIVASVRPAWFWMENVIPAARSAAWAEARAILERAGYGISESRIDASYYSVAQSRRRLMVIGRLGERDSFLESAVASAASSRPMTLRQLFAQPDDAPLIENGFIYSRPVRAGRGVRSIDESFPTVTRTSWERPTPRYLSAPHPKDPVKATDTAVLSMAHLSRIQGFASDWQWEIGTKRDRLQMIANAVPPPAAKVIGEVILARHRGESLPLIEGRFLDWLVFRGKSRASARNVKSHLNRARRILNGRTFADAALEVLAIEATPSFEELPKGTKSDLRQALRLYAEFKVEKDTRVSLSRKRQSTAISLKVAA
jgi:DNA (cytosine-5)-methyltransferase 1